MLSVQQKTPAMVTVDSRKGDHPGSMQKQWAGATSEGHVEEVVGSLGDISGRAEVLGWGGSLEMQWPGRWGWGGTCSGCLVLGGDWKAQGDTHSWHAHPCTAPR